MAVRLIGAPTSSGSIRYVGQPANLAHVRYAGLGPALNERFMLALTGQSNMAGSGPGPALSTTQPFDNLRRSGVSAVALVETALESPASGIANFLTQQEAGRGSIVHNWAVAATAYSGLARGTGVYNNAQTAVANSRTAINTLRPTEVFNAGCLVAVHGETDEANGVTAAAYDGFMDTWQSDWQSDTRTLLGMPTAVIPLIYSQHGCWTLLNPNRDFTQVAIGQWTAARDNPNIYLACPTYMLPYATADIHFTNVGYRRLARYLGKALRAVHVLGQDWRPLQPARADGVNNVITLTLEGGDGSAIVRDTTNMLTKPFDGFEYTDSQADVPAISSVAVTGARTVQITLTRNVQSGARIRYAYSAVPGASSGPTSNGGPGGNIRDQDATPTGDGDNPLWNWLVSFDHALDSISGAASPTWAFVNTQSLSLASSAFTSARRVTTMDGAANCTWSFYIRVTAGGWVGSDAAIISRNNTNQRQFDFRARAGGNMRFFVNSSLTDTANFGDTTGWTGAAWHHVVVVKSGTTLLVYRNNVSLTVTMTGAVPATMTSNARSDLEIGASTVGGATFPGNIAHVAIWSGIAFSAADVSEQYNSNVARDPRLHSQGAPSHYWPLQGTYEDVGSATSFNLFPYVGATFAALAPP
jgi:hypothetical protein